MKHDRTEHRFLPDAAPSEWKGTNVYRHAPGGGSTRMASEFGARADVEESRPVPPANTLSSTPGPEHAWDAPPASTSLSQPRPTSANLTVPALLSTQAWGPMDSLPRNDALWDSSGSRATDGLRSGGGAPLRNSYTAPGEGLGRAAGGGEGGPRRYSTPLGLLRSEGSAAGQGTGLVATPLTEGALQADASGYVLHRNASQLSHIFGPAASHATEVPHPTVALPTPALPLTLALALIFNPRPDSQPQTPTPTITPTPDPRRQRRRRPRNPDSAPDAETDPKPRPPPLTTTTTTEPGAGAVPASHGAEPQHAAVERPRGTLVARARRHGLAHGPLHWHARRHRDAARRAVIRPHRPAPAAYRHERGAAIGLKVHADAAQATL